MSECILFFVRPGEHAAAARVIRTTENLFDFSRVLFAWY
jgi:hypothetical protein